MAKRKARKDPFARLTWRDLEQWAGSRIVSRGQNYQKQGRVSELARTDDGGLIAWVDGSHQYATKVVIGKDGALDSVCTCPYQSDCKHGVATVLEYLDRVEKNQQVPKVRPGDERLVLVEWEPWEDDGQEGFLESTHVEIEPFLSDMSKAQLLDLLLMFARDHPEIAQELRDRKQIASGSTKTLVSRLRKEIREIGSELAWSNRWTGEGHTPDYSGICTRLNALLEAGYADEVLSLGRELVIVGTSQVEQSDDEGETLREIAACMPAIVKALSRSSLSAAARLAWAVEVLLEDEYDICEVFLDYIDRKHSREAWDALANRLLAQLKASESSGKNDEFSRSYARDRISNWAICALENAERIDEILPLCEAEAPKTHSYDRLVAELVRRRRYEDAERWIREGIRATEDKWPGVAQSLRDRFKEIRGCQKDLPVLATLAVEEFVDRPSPGAFADCEKSCRKLQIWSQVREHLLRYLERGTRPWKQKGWPLPSVGLGAAEPSTGRSFPMIDVLIEIAMHEKDPQRVLYWYDRQPKRQFGWPGGNEDRVASAVADYAPDRAVAIWKGKAERLIAQTTPRAYDEAVAYLRKVAKVMTGEGKQQQWNQYLQGLRTTHARKRRFIASLKRLSDKPIVNVQETCS